MKTMNRIELLVNPWTEEELESARREWVSWAPLPAYLVEFRPTARPTDFDAPTPADDVEHAAYELGYSGETEDAAPPEELAGSLRKLWCAAFKAGCDARWADYYEAREQMEEFVPIDPDPLDERYAVADGFSGHDHS